MRAILSFLLPKPPTPLTPPTGEHKPTLHGIYGHADGDTMTLLNAIISTMGPLALATSASSSPSTPPSTQDGPITPPATTTSATTTLTTPLATTVFTTADILRNAPGSLVLVRQDDSTALSFEQYTLYWIGEKIERGWVSKSTTPTLHVLGSFVVITTPETVLTHSRAMNMTDAIDNTIVHLHDAQKRLDAVHNNMERSIKAIKILTNENKHLRKLLTIKHVDKHLLPPADFQNSNTNASSDPWGWMNREFSEGTHDTHTPMSELDQLVLAARNDAFVDDIRQSHRAPSVIEAKHDRTYEDIQQAVVLDARHQESIDNRIATIWVENVSSEDTNENYECGIRDPRSPRTTNTQSTTVDNQSVPI